MLKTVIHKIICLTLAVAIVFSATGITVFKMACSKSKTFNVSLGQFENCCKKSKATSCAVNKSCCDFSQNTISSVQQFFNKTDFAFSITEIQLIKFFLADFQFENNSPVSADLHSPPVISNADILLRVQKFTI